MRVFLPTFLFVLLARVALAEVPLSSNQSAFHNELAAEVAALETKNASVAVGADGWLFLSGELRFLAKGRFWGEAAAKTGRTRKTEWADPIPAIVDFQRQLRERGIALVLVPVPPKAAIYPEKIGLQASVMPSDSAPYLQEFYGELKRRGVDVLDLTPTFAAHRDDARGPLYCRTDSHWSGAGCVLAAQTIAQQVRKILTAEPARATYRTDWKQVAIDGDLVSLGGAKKSGAEQIAVREIAGGVQPDANSPVLLLGDSHTLVFHEFLGERGGLLDQLAAELGFAPDLIGTRGSGATAVRLSLYRKTRSDPGYLAKKKIVIWCFAAREFTEADQGWVVQPIAK
ncbi:MAG: alginate O-acetyltransferase AlgX-related protein [Chthoniobacterales bacterium]